MEQQNQNTEKKKRMLLVLPLLLVPFITLMFWSLGGGSATGGQQAGPGDAGFNAQVPGANNIQEPSDKMGFYTQAEKEEMELQKQQKRDPYYNMRFDTLSGPGAGAMGSERQWLQDSGDEVERKLERLSRQMETGSRWEATQLAQPEVQVPPGGVELRQLEQAMAAMAGGGQEDAELRQVSGLMESILDLQHPERVQQRLKRLSAENRGNVYAVSALPPSDPVTMVRVPGDSAISPAGFFGLQQGGPEGQQLSIPIRAVVHQEQTVVNGSVVKLRLADPVYINGTLVPKDIFIYGIAALSGERLNIEISGIRSGRMIFPVELAIYDMDGLPGIHIPGAITRDVAKQGGERAMQNLGMATFDPSLGAQAASAGLEITRNLLSKKVKLVKVQLKAGYQVMLVDQKFNNTDNR